MSLPLEAFGMIGDGATVALVSNEGSIDWMCLPRFDSPACCAALLGTPDHGHWSIRPEGQLEHRVQRYQPDTLVLETDMTTADGSIRITDFMPPRDHDPVLMRIVTGVKGTVAICMSAALRFDYGKMAPWIERSGEGIMLRVGPDEVQLSGAEDADIDRDVVRLRFTLEPGERRVFTLRHRQFEDTPNWQTPVPDADAALAATQRHWRDWIGRLDRRTDHPQALRRSLLTLKCLVHHATGGLVAAPTTSLPEKPGGEMNWDYRYCWLRDASFTVSALLDCGFHEEARAWRDWILRAVAAAPDKMAIVYRVDGSRRLDESNLEWLPGYRFAQPVRIGNAAAGQFQLDVYGELMNTLHLCEAAGLKSSDQMRHLKRAIAEHVEQVWTHPDQGLWEGRGMPHNYTYSKAMAWVAIDRFLRGTGSADLDEAERSRFENLRTHMHGVICTEAFDPGMNTFTSYFGGEELDASVLLLPKLGFVPVDDPRMTGTIAAIEQGLVHGGLVWRNRSTGLVSEGAFLACTCWLAECQLLQGRHEAARASIERVLGVANGLGLLAEEYDLNSKRLAGNFPQALSHIALVNALLALEQATSPPDTDGQGDVERRDTAPPVAHR